MSALMVVLGDLSPETVSSAASLPKSCFGSSLTKFVEVSLRSTRTGGRGDCEPTREVLAVSRYASRRGTAIEGGRLV